MKTTLLFCLLFPVFLFAQNETAKKNSISANFGLSMGHQTTGLKAYKPLLNYRGGFNYERTLCHGFSFKVGSHVATWGFIPDYNSPDPYQIRQEYLSIEIPLSLKYSIGKQKTKPYVEMGVSPMMIGNMSTITHVGNTSNPFVLATHLGLGISHQISSKFSIFGQCTGRMIVTPFFKNEWRQPENTVVYNIGIDLGVAFHF